MPKKKKYPSLPEGLFFATATELAIAGVVDAPFAIAVKAAVVLLTYFDADRATVRASTAGMQPMPVAIQRILDNVVIHRQRYAVAWGEGGGSILPGLALHIDQRNVSLVSVVLQDGVGELVEQVASVSFCLIGDGVRGG